jgi:hypothetical protein
MSEKSEALPIDQHPGVQGLAHIWRNAIDRVIELEQARARDNIAFKQLLAQRDALLEALKYHQEQTRPIQRTLDVIKAVEEGK